MICIQMTEPRNSEAELRPSVSLLVGSDSETNSTATATVLKYLLATLGAVALAKAMSAEAAGIAGLKCTLGHVSSRLVPAVSGGITSSKDNSVESDAYRLKQTLI
jgi:hypothetical protein